MLSNRIYVGEVVHKDKVYPGEHEPIVSREVFDAVQTKLADRTASSSGSVRKRVSLLAGMIHDDVGRPMSPCHTRNHGRRYSYYASSMNDDASSPALRLPAGELELSVRNTIAEWLRDGDMMRELASGRNAEDIERLFKCCSDLATRITTAPVSEARTEFERIALQVVVTAKGAAASFDLAVLGLIAGMADIPEKRICLEIPTSQSNYGHEPRLRLEPANSGSISRDERLVELIARAYSAREKLLCLDQHQLDALPVTKLRHLQRTARVSYLDPTIIRAILGGAQPSRLSARSLWRMSDLPLDWAGQRQMLGIDAART